MIAISSSRFLFPMFGMVVAIVLLLGQTDAAEEPKKTDPPTDVLYLNLNAQGELLIAGRAEPLKTEDQIKQYLALRFADARNAAKANGEEEVRTVVIIRASKDADFPAVFGLLREAKTAGFRHWQLRAVEQANQAKPGVVVEKPQQGGAELTVLVRPAANDNTAIGPIVVRSGDASVTLRDVAAMEKYLAARRPDLTNRDDIRIESASKMKYGAVIEVMDACLKAGFTKVGFLPPSDGDK
jgi:biopolymer transport protein ExbD